MAKKAIRIPTFRVTIRPEFTPHYRSLLNPETGLAEVDAVRIYLERRPGMAAVQTVVGPVLWIPDCRNL